MHAIQRNTVLNTAHVQEVLTQLITKYRDDGQHHVQFAAKDNTLSISTRPMNDLQSWLSSRQRDVLLVDASCWVCPGVTNLTTRLCAYGRTLSASCAAFTPVAFPTAYYHVVHVQQPCCDTSVQQLVCSDPVPTGPTNCMHLLPVCYLCVADCHKLAHALHDLCVQDVDGQVLTKALARVVGLHGVQVGAAVPLTTLQGWAFAQDLVHMLVNDAGVMLAPSSSHHDDDRYVRMHSDDDDDILSMLHSSPQ